MYSSTQNKYYATVWFEREYGIQPKLWSLKRIWNIPESKKRVKSETLRKFLQRLHGDLEKHAILLFVEPVKDDEGKIYAYKIIQPTIKMKKN
jgi:hypothetical protein